MPLATVSVTSSIFVGKLTRPAWLVSRLGGGTVGADNSYNTVRTNPGKPPTDGGIALFGTE